jgi:hypothetical protein
MSAFPQRCAEDLTTPNVSPGATFAEIETIYRGYQVLLFAGSASGIVVDLHQSVVQLQKRKIMAAFGASTPDHAPSPYGPVQVKDAS